MPHRPPQRRLATVALAATVLGLCAGSARAHDEPKRAKSVKSPLVTSYLACTAPNTVTSGDVPLPACAPPVRSDPECGFQGPNFQAGQGKAAASTTSMGDLRLSFAARGLGPGCEGRRLCAAASLRMTTDRCEVHPCTIDLPDFFVNSATGCCTVRGGSCKVSTTINSELLGTLLPGEKTGIEFIGCGLKRVDGPNAPSGFTFGCGVLAP